MEDFPDRVSLLSGVFVFGDEFGGDGGAELERLVGLVVDRGESKASKRSASSSGLRRGGWGAGRGWRRAWPRFHLVLAASFRRRIAVELALSLSQISPSLIPRRQ